MNEIDIVIYILALISVSSVSIQIAFLSPLVDKVKQMFYLSPTQVRLDPFYKLKNWLRVLGITTTIILSPVFLLFKVHELIKDMINCPYCNSFWLMLIVNYCYFNLTIVTAVLFTPIVLLPVLLMILLIDK
jgi:hypothetical protein